MRVIIVGAGIGGATLALSLQTLGLDYVLLEQAPQFGEVGAGLQLSPNGVRVLERLGLKDELARFCAEPDLNKYAVWDSGEIILRTALMPKVREVYGCAHYNAYRPDLIAALTEPLERAHLRLGKTVTSVGQDGDRVWADCRDGSRYEGDVLIGADGIHSVVREQVFKPDPPRPSGYVSWRGVVDSDKIADLEIPVSAYVDMGPGQSFVYYYVSSGKRLNWVALGRTDAKKRESWSQTTSRSEVLAAFDDWYDRPRKVIERTEQPFVMALHDRHPLDTWVSGRISLSGDAAHAMLPYHAQGAVQAIEDAWVLARCLQMHADDAPGALLAYERLRYDRANRIVLQCRNAEGWYHVEDPSAVEQRNARFVRHNERYGGGFTPQQHWLYSYDAEKAVLGTDDEWRALPGW